MNDLNDWQDSIVRYWKVKRKLMLINISIKDTTRLIIPSFEQDFR
jgi:hypothetical protein